MTNKNKSKLIGKIGYYHTNSLPCPPYNNHYVFIRKDLGGNKCLVSSCTSLEQKFNYFDKKKKKNTSAMIIKYKKMFSVRDKKIYAVPKRDSNFALWTGVNKDMHTVQTSDISNIGVRYIKSCHHKLI